MTMYREQVYRRAGIMLFVRTLLILLCFVSVSQAQLANFLNALSQSDSGATIMGNPSGNTPVKSVLFHFATVVDSMMKRQTNIQTNALDYNGGAYNQATIEAAIADTDSGVVFIPAGTWVITDTIQLKSNIIVQGAGVGATVLDRAKKSVTGGLFSITTNDNIVIRNLTIRGHAKDNAAYDEFMHGIFIANARNIWIYNLEIENFGGDGISVSDTSSSVFIFDNIISIPNKAPVADTLVGRNGISVVGGKNIWIVGNHIKDGGLPAGIDIEPANGDSVVGVYIYDNTVTSPGTGSSGIGISLIETDEVQTIKSIFVERNDVSNWDVGIKTSGPDSIIVIKNNKVHHNATWGILITGSDNVLVEGNEVYRNTTHGIEATTNQDNIHIIGNRSSFNGGFGIGIVGSSGNELRNSVVSNNITWNNSQTTDGIREGILIAFADSTICIGNVSYNDLGLTNRQKFGFVINSSDGVIFKNNASWNNKDGELSVATANTDFTNFGNSLGFKSTFDMLIPAAVTVRADSGTLAFGSRTVASGGANTGTITFGTNSSEAMRIDSNGDVGIGDTNPERPLHVNSLLFNTGIRVESTDADALIEFVDNSASASSPYIGGRGDDIIIGRISTIRMILKDSGSIGIGTATPGDKFVVVANDTMAYGGFQTAAYISSANQDAFWFDPGGDTLFIKNNGTVRFILSTSYAGSGH